MKKKILFIATLLVVAATTIAVVSCKKETQDTLLGNKAHPAKTFSPPEVDDMNAYLKEFKLKMQNATRGDDETLSLEEAAWHLGSMANADFGYVNTSYDDIRFDTLYSHVAVYNGDVNLSDLNDAYTEIVNSIESFYQNLRLDNLHCRFVDALILENGQITVSLLSTYITSSRQWGDTLWYFPDIFAYTDSIFDLYLNEDSTYIWCTVASRELDRIFNILEGHPYVDNPLSQHNIYYVKTREHTFCHEDHIDPFGSPFYRNSRLFYGLGDYGNTNIEISYEHMEYCVDSYLGLGIQYLQDYPGNWEEDPVEWKVIPGSFYNMRRSFNFHDLKVTYGRLVVSQEQGDI